MLRLLLFAIVGIGIWTLLVAWALLEGWTRDPIATENDPAAFIEAIATYIDEHGQGNVAVLLFEDKDFAGDLYRGPVDEETLFPLASTSKFVTAIGVMALVEQGLVDLDAPVDDYLQRWSLPPSEFDNSEVTIRRLLSHTAGLTDGLGFGDYGRDETVPSLVESLKDPRGSSGKPIRVGVGVKPGSEFIYSGGSYLVLELMVEDVTGTTFETYMNDLLFQPLGMSRTTYEPLFEHTNVAPPLTDDGETGSHYQYASSAATALASTPRDLRILVQAMLDGDLPISPGTFDAMRRPEALVMGQPMWGLGTIQHAPNDNGVYVYGHAGGNEPAINTDIRLNPATDDALVVLATGNSSIATRIGFLWTFWQTGRPDFFGLVSEIKRLLPFYLAGLIVILISCIWSMKVNRPDSLG